MDTKQVILALIGAATLGLSLHGSTIYYVTPEGDNAAAGTSWTTAFQSIDKPLTQAQDGDTVLVSNGVYAITAQLELTNGVALRSVNGAGKTTIRRTSGSTRILYLSHPDAVVDGFTVRDGSAPGPNNNIGGGILLDGHGTVSNCVITANTINMNCLGGGIGLKNGGYLYRCVITNNISRQVTGGGVSVVKSGLVEECLIADNRLNYSAYGGAGVYLEAGGTLRNCIVANNTLDFIHPGNQN